MFWILLLAHFLGDYPLQPNWLVRAKTRWPGLILHVSIHLAGMSALSGPAVSAVWPLLVGIALVHLVIDWSKNQAQRLWPKRLPLLYLIDQALHYLTLLMAVQMAQRLPDWQGLRFSIPANWAILVTAYLVSTYVWFISERILSLNQEGYYRAVLGAFWPRLLVRAGLLTALLLGRSAWQGAAGLAAPLILASPFLLVTSRALRCPPAYQPYCARALLTDLAVALAAFAFTWVEAI
jgi:hypothetical protein